MFWRSWIYRSDERRPTMALYGAKTDKSPEEVVEQARAYFGEDGLGLENTADNPCCVTFQGGGGHVSVTAEGKEGHTEVEVETREWDYHVRKFIQKI
jgi:hypothetical protein